MPIKGWNVYREEIHTSLVPLKAGDPIDDLMLHMKFSIWLWKDIILNFELIYCNSSNFRSAKGSFRNTSAQEIPLLHSSFLCQLSIVQIAGWLVKINKPLIRVLCFPGLSIMHPLQNAGLVIKANNQLHFMTALSSVLLLAWGILPTSWGEEQ